MYVFGVFLVFTGLRMAFKKEEKADLESNRMLRLIRRILPVSKNYHGDKFFVVEDGVRKATPMLLVLVFIEITDVVFAFDSVPAAFSVTRDPFIIFSSNLFAILGLRSLYFALAGVLHRLRFLSYGLALILVFLGVKMLVGEFTEVPIPISLGGIGLILVMAVTASLIWSHKHPEIPPGECKIPE